jgi:hypothetical protein
LAVEEIYLAIESSSFHWRSRNGDAGGIGFLQKVLNKAVTNSAASTGDHYQARIHNFLGIYLNLTIFDFLPPLTPPKALLFETLRERACAKGVE